MAMKFSSFIKCFLLLVVSIYGVNAQETTTPLEVQPFQHTPYPVGSEAEKSFREGQEWDPKRPMVELPITYMANPKDSKLRPAYMRYESAYSSERIYYVWKDIVLNHAQIPNNFWNRPFHNLSVTDVSQFPRVRIREVVPPFYYYKPNSRSNYLVGYFDHTAGIFYHWKGVELSESEIPAEAFQKNYQC